jgi:hypothetical protein
VGSVGDDERTAVAVAAPVNLSDASTDAAHGQANSCVARDRVENHELELEASVGRKHSLEGMAHVVADRGGVGADWQRHGDDNKRAASSLRQSSEHLFGAAVSEARACNYVAA